MAEIWRKQGENGGNREKNGAEHPVFKVPFSPFFQEVEDFPVSTL